MSSCAKVTHNDSKRRHLIKCMIFKEFRTVPYSLRGVGFSLPFFCAEDVAEAQGVRAAAELELESCALPGVHEMGRAAHLHPTSSWETMRA